MNYGEIIYNNFTYSLPYTKKYFFKMLSFFGSILIIGFLILIFNLSNYLIISKLRLFLILLIIPSLVLIILSIYFIKKRIIDHHEYILFDTGILCPGYSYEKFNFIRFINIGEIHYFPTKKIALKKIRPTYMKYRKNIPKKEWKDYGIDSKSMEVEANEIMKSIFFLLKPKNNQIRNSYFYLDGSYFKNVNRFKKLISPFLLKYRIKTYN